MPVGPHRERQRRRARPARGRDLPGDRDRGHHLHAAGEGRPARGPDGHPPRAPPPLVARRARAHPRSHRALLGAYRACRGRGEPAGQRGAAPGPGPRHLRRGLPHEFGLAGDAPARRPRLPVRPGGAERALARSLRRSGRQAGGQGCGQRRGPPQGPVRARAPGPARRRPRRLDAVARGAGDRSARDRDRVVRDGERRHVPARGRRAAQGERGAVPRHGGRRPGDDLDHRRERRVHLPEPSLVRVHGAGRGRGTRARLARRDPSRRPHPVRTGVPGGERGPDVVPPRIPPPEQGRTLPLGARRRLAAIRRRRRVSRLLRVGDRHRRAPRGRGTAAYADRRRASLRLVSPRRTASCIS